jgi:hypothetical protein
MKLFFGDLPQSPKFLLSDAIKLYLPACLFIIVVWFIGKAFGISMYELTADPAELAGKPPYIGLFSQLGSLLWCGTAAICIFTAFLTRADPITGRRWFIFLLASFFLTVSLLIDDMFQFHEYYHAIFFGFKVRIPLENRTLQNIFELAYFVVMYFVAFALYLFYFKQHIRHTEYIYFVLAIFLSGLSIVVDMAGDAVPGHSFIEESAKFLGILSWITYFSRTCSSIIRQLIAKVALHPDKG